MITRRTASNPASSRTGSAYTTGLQVKSSSFNGLSNSAYATAAQTAAPETSKVLAHKAVTDTFQKLANDEAYLLGKNFYEGFNQKFLADFEATYPVEHTLFKKYAVSIDASLWGSEFRHFELAWRNFDLFARTGSFEMLSKSAHDFIVSVYGPQNVLSAIPGKIGTALGFYNDIGSVHSGSNLIDITNEALNININGSQVINQGLFTEAFGKPYDPQLNLLVK